MPIGLCCILHKQLAAISQQYRLLDTLKGESESFTPLGRTLQALTRVTIPCVHSTVACRKCRDVINKADKLQKAYLAEVKKLKSMMPYSDLCS